MANGSPRRLNASLAAAIARSRKSVGKLRSKFYICMVFTLVLQTMQGDHERFFAQYSRSPG